MRRAVGIVTLLLMLVFSAAAYAVPTPPGGEYEWNGHQFTSEWTASENRWGLDSEGNLEVIHRNNPSDGGSVQRKWTPEEWEANRGEIEVEAECLGRTDDCVKDIDEGETRLPRGVPQPEIEKGSEVITDLREEAPTGPEPEVTEGLDTLGEWGGTLDAGALVAAAGTLAGGLLLGPEYFKIGVAIGNNLDQLFGLPEWNWGAEKDEVEAARKIESGPAHVDYTPGDGEYHYVPGYYLEGHACDGGLYCSYAEIETAAAEVHLSPAELTCIDYNESSHLEQLTCAAANGHLTAALVCPAPYEKSGCETPQRFKEEDLPAAPQAGGIPVPNSESQEDENESHEEGPYASRKKVPRLPVAPTATENAPKLPAKGHKREPVVPEVRVREPLENPPVAETVVPSPERVKEETKEHEEEKKKLLPEAYPGETAKQYQKRLEGLGFTDVTVVELGELNENPDVGPEQVANVNPRPGEDVGAEAKITVSENPKNAPETGSKESGSAPETGGSTGPPTEPGFKLPSLGVLCKGFPFGVPCWVAETVSSWSTSAEAPEWGVNEFEVEHTKIPPIKVKLSKLEPIMEYVRPAIVIFATIGLVLLFFNFAKGGGPPSGSNSDLGPAPWNNIPEGD